MANDHQHYSGYVPSPPKAGHGYFYGYGNNNVGRGYGATSNGRSPSPLVSPPTRPSPSPPISVSPTPNTVTPPPPSHKHATKKLDNLFKHLVKWGSPHKDKQNHSSTSASNSTTSKNTSGSTKSACTPTTAVPPVISISGTTSPPGNIYSTTPTKCTPNIHHSTNHHYASYYWANRRSSSCASDRSSNAPECSDDDSDSGEETSPSGEDEVDNGYLKAPPDYRNRSQSVDISPRRQQLRGRRYSEGTPRYKDNSQTHQTYTIYESIIKEGGRRSSVNFHRPSDACIDSAHAAILFRDARGLPHVDPFLDRLLFSENEENEILVKFFKFHKCYDLIPTSAKLVVFDTQLLVKKAFFALVYNGVRAAPLWDSTERKIVGMLTITDFIRVLHAMYHDSAGSTGKMSELEEHRVETWRKRFLLNRQPLVFIDPDSSLYEAICSLVNNRIHRLPVIDRHTGNVLHILTHKRILKFLFLYINEIPRPSFLNKPLREVKIGSFDKIETAREDTPIIMALQKFLERRVSALPIVDDQNRLLSIYARFDVINLAAEKTYSNLDITLKQANEHRNEWFEGVHKCTLDETLFVVMDRIVKAEVHRLVVVDEQDRVAGVISLSDILQYLVMRPELQELRETNIKEALKKQNSDEVPADDAKNGLQDSNDSACTSLTPEPPKDQNSSEINENESSDCSERENPTIFEEDDEKT